VFEDGSEAGVQSGLFAPCRRDRPIKAPAGSDTSYDNTASSIVGFLAAGIDGTNREFYVAGREVPSGFYISKDTIVIKAKFINYRP
jgi:hypothetical protein